ncbi:hypothetical protein ACLOJK_010052 [Asimina triloba]
MVIDTTNVASSRRVIYTAYAMSGVQKAMQRERQTVSHTAHGLGRVAWESTQPMPCEIRSRRNKDVRDSKSHGLGRVDGNSTRPMPCTPFTVPRRSTEHQYGAPSSIFSGELACHPPTPPPTANSDDRQPFLHLRPWQLLHAPCVRRAATHHPSAARSSCCSATAPFPNPRSGHGQSPIQPATHRQHPRLQQLTSRPRLPPADPPDPDSNPLNEQPSPTSKLSAAISPVESDHATSEGRERPNIHPSRSSSRRQIQTHTAAPDNPRPSRGLANHQPMASNSQAEGIHILESTDEERVVDGQGEGHHGQARDGPFVAFDLRELFSTLSSPETATSLVITRSLWIRYYICYSLRPVLLRRSSRDRYFIHSYITFVITYTCVGNPQQRSMKMIAPSNVVVDIGQTLKPHEYIAWSGGTKTLRAQAPSHLKGLADHFFGRDLV